DLCEVIQTHHKTFQYRIKVRNLVKCLPLAALGSLAVTGVHQGQFMRLPRNRRGNARIHPAAQQDHRLGLLAHPVRTPLYMLDADSNPTDNRVCVATQECLWVTAPARPESSASAMA